MIKGHVRCVVFPLNKARNSVNILSLLICLDQGLIPGHMCQNTKLDLGIVCIKKNAAIFRYKNFTDQSPKFHTYRDILKIRLCAADPAGCSNGQVL